MTHPLEERRGYPVVILHGADLAVRATAAGLLASLRDSGVDSQVIELDANDTSSSFEMHGIPRPRGVFAVGADAAAIVQDLLEPLVNHVIPVLLEPTSGRAEDTIDDRLLDVILASSHTVCTTERVRHGIAQRYPEIDQQLVVASEEDGDLDWKCLTGLISRRDSWIDSGLEGRRIAIAGYDYKFAGELIEGLRLAGASVRLDDWYGGPNHNETLSDELVAWADTIICEWCLANAAWYSRQKAAHQKLIVRFHRTELNSPWPVQVDMTSVDRMVFVGPHVLDAAQHAWNWDAHRLTTIANFVDAIVFDRPKHASARFTLGLLGYLPSLKRLDLAFDLLEQLRTHDERYRLIVRGEKPETLPWLWNNADQRAYYHQQRDRVSSSRLLSEAVTFEEKGPDVAEWMRSVGFILSLSDIESFHLAMIEGMASGCVPIVADRVGAASIVEREWIVSSTTEAAGRISAMSTESWSDLGARAQEEIARRYPIEATIRSWVDLLI